MSALATSARLWWRWAPFRQNEPRPPRRFHAYCVSIGKSGTHSIANLFAGHYRSRHEPEAPQTIELIAAGTRGEISRDAFARLVRARDRALWLEMESAALTFYLLDAALAEFPDARFLLTVRDAYSWLGSIINHHFTRKPKKTEWYTFRQIKWGRPGARHGPEERVLAERGLFTVDEYLAAWADHQRTVLSRVPEDRLFVGRTVEIARDVPRIAAFVGVPAETLNAAEAHAFKLAKPVDLLADIDEGYLEEKFEAHCGELMRTLFPEMPRYREWRAAQRDASPAAAS